MLIASKICDCLILLLTTRYRKTYTLNEHVGVRLSTAKIGVLFYVNFFFLLLLFLCFVFLFSVFLVQICVEAIFDLQYLASNR